jgi:hypothetical protein
MDKWEYKNVSGINIDLDKLGEEGWEMCGVKGVIFGMSEYYFKRKKDA